MQNFNYIKYVSDRIELLSHLSCTAFFNDLNSQKVLLRQNAKCRIFKIFRNMCAMNHSSIMNLYTQCLYRESISTHDIYNKKGEWGRIPTIKTSGPGLCKLKVSHIPRWRYSSRHHPTGTWRWTWSRPSPRSRWAAGTCRPPWCCPRQRSLAPSASPLPLRVEDCDDGDDEGACVCARAPLCVCT